jgi:hypothetical protein
LGGQGVQCCAGGSCERLMPARNGPIGHYTLFRRLRQDSYLSHMLSCLSKL